MGSGRTSRIVALKMMYLPGTSIEIINSKLARGQIQRVLFDFDGTLSLIREGWQRVMTSLMMEMLLETPKGRELGEKNLYSMVANYIDETTGVQTIFQMKWLADKVTEFGGRALDPWEYKRIYNDRLLAQISTRLAALRAGKVSPDDYLIPGAREFLCELNDLGVKCYLASGTDEVYVKEEAQLLQIEQYFAGIYGAEEGNWQEAKRRVIKTIIGQYRLRGGEFAAFGDGFVEMQEAKTVDGIAVGVASDEVCPGRLNPWKRERLICAGADVIVPDFKDHEALVRYLFKKEG